jgi:hypothetical protein
MSGVVDQGISNRPTISLSTELHQSMTIQAHTFLFTEPQAASPD